MTSQFSLQCPICCSQVVVVDHTATCIKNQHRFRQADGIWRFLPMAQEAKFKQFSREYLQVRKAEGWARSQPDYYRSLPHVSRGDPQRAVWRIREHSFTRLLDWIGRFRPLRVLDSGAGNGWLSYQLSKRGHIVSAVDISDDGADGLGARTNYDASFECFQAEFDRLPFVDSDFDLVIFNAALHYSPALDITLSEARRVLTPNGRIAVLDSPFYDETESGAAMVSAREKSFSEQYGFNRQIHQVSYLTREKLELAAGAATLRMEVLSTDDGLRTRVKRTWTKMRTGRELARFPLIGFEKISEK